MHGASRHLLKPRVACLRLQQQQATSAQAKIDLALFAALILWMYWRVAFVPGGQAIGALETWLSKMGKRVGKLFRRRRPASHEAVSAAGE